MARLIKKALPQRLSYVEARSALEQQNLELRLELAERADANPEMLYYLATDEEPQVRALVAANAGTPRQADRLLADDGADEVRCELARKISRLLPDLQEPEKSHIQSLTLEILETLARDQLPKVRQIVAEEIKASTLVPQQIVQDLARDVELTVSAPILQYSPLLSDEDLKEIIASGCVSGALQSIARRDQLGESLADAVVATLDIPAVANLLANPNAQIREETLDRIIDNAEHVEAWHEPLVMRPDLSVRAARRIASFVAVSLLDRLADRHGLDAATIDQLRKRVRARLHEETADGETSPMELARQAVDAAEAEGRLDEDFVGSAIDAGSWPQVLHALSRLTEVSPAKVNRLMHSRSPKAITAMAWAAGLSMRSAVRLQTEIAQIRPNEILHARNGTDFPIFEQEMRWHLECFDITTEPAGD